MVVECADTTRVVSHVSTQYDCFVGSGGGIVLGSVRDCGFFRRVGTGVVNDTVFVVVVVTSSVDNRDGENDVFGCTV